MYVRVLLLALAFVAANSQTCTNGDDAAKAFGACLVKWSYGAAFSPKTQCERAEEMMNCYRTSKCTQDFDKICKSYQKDCPDLNCCNPGTNKAPASLRQIHILHRHGDRTSIGGLPCVPIKWDIGGGKLTALGMQQGKKIGQIVRDWYDGFIPCTYKADDIEIISSIKDRTAMTAQSALMGLYADPLFDVPFVIGDTKYEAGQTPGFPSAPIFQVVREVDNRNADLYIRAYDNCKKVNPDEGTTPAFLEPDFVKKMDSFKELATEVAKKTCFDQTPNYNLTESLRRYYSQFDPIYTGKTHDKLGALDSYFDADKMKKLMEISGYSFGARYKDYGKEFGGPLVGLFRDRMESKKTKDEGKKVYWYSGHDTTLVAVMSAIKMQYGWTNQPPYGSFLAFELHEIGADWFVRLKFRKGNGLIWTRDQDDSTESTVEDWCAASPEADCKVNADGMCPYKCVLALFNDRGVTVDQWNTLCGNS